MTASQNDGLKRPRWSYEGESFVVRYVHPHEKSKMESEEFQLLGRPFAIESNALKRLSGGILTLRKVDSRIGLFNMPRYVLVAGPAGPLPGREADVAPGGPNERITNYVSVAGLTILGGFTGIGAAWIIYSITVTLLRIPVDRLFGSRLVWPILAIGWILGAIISFFYFASVFKGGGPSGSSRSQKQSAYRVQGDLRKHLDWWIFLGVPAPLMAVAVLIIRQLAHTTNQEAYGAVVAVMVILGGTMYFCDRMLRRLVIWLGSCGWVLTLAIGFWYFKTYGP